MAALRRFGSLVPTCAEVISPTSAARLEAMRTEAIELRLGAVVHPLSR